MLFDKKTQTNICISNNFEVKRIIFLRSQTPHYFYISILINSKFRDFFEIEFLPDKFSGFLKKKISSKFIISIKTDEFLA